MPTRFLSDIYGKENVIIDASLVDDNANGKLINGKLYIPLKVLTALLPRIGYLIGFDDDNKVININNYNFEKEKNLVMEKFPANKFGTSIYDKEYENYFEYTELRNTAYSCTDVFSAQFKKTLNIQLRYSNFIDPFFREIYSIKEDDTEKFKGLLESAYGQYIDEDVFVEYDDELEAYVIYNKDFKNVEELDDTYKILVIRKIDNMVLYCWDSSSIKN